MIREIGGRLRKAADLPLAQSLIIGLTLAVNEEFNTLFVVLVFHQMFEGLGLGSRLSALSLPTKFKWGEYRAVLVVLL